jgi:hypothetical protein
MLVSEVWIRSYYKCCHVSRRLKGLAEWRALNSQRCCDGRTLDKEGTERLELAWSHEPIEQGQLPLENE